MYNFCFHIVRIGLYCVALYYQNYMPELFIRILRIKIINILNIIIFVFFHLYYATTLQHNKDKNSPTMDVCTRDVFFSLRRRRV